MKINRFQRFAALILSIPISSCMMNSPAQAAPAASGVWSDWITALQAQGYTVTQGDAILHNCDALVAVFKNCNGNNPAGHYVDSEPPIDDEYVDPCYNAAHDCSGKTANLFTGTATVPTGSTTSVNQFFRVNDTDAIVLVINLPPKAAYFGTQTYDYSRARSQYSQGCKFFSSDKAPNPCRNQTRASIGSAVNNVVIKNQTGLDLGSGGTVAVVTTSNQALFDALGNAFSGVGGDKNLLLAEPLGATITAGTHTAGVITGVDSNGDELNTLIRYTLPEDETAADDWQNSIADNIQVFRIRKADGPVTVYNNVSLATKQFANDDTVYKPALNELANSLSKWLTSVNSSFALRRLVTTSATYSASGVPMSGYIGPICLETGTNCLRDTQDTDSYRFGNPGKLDRTIVVVGVNGAYTGNSTYTSLGIARADLFEGISTLAQTNPTATGFSSGTLGGSASDLVATLVAAGQIPQPSQQLTAALPNLYVGIITRACASPSDPSAPFFCAKNYTVNVDETEVPANVAIQTVQRNYILPGQPTGANPYYVATPIVLK